jgi:hypothetical protein
MKHLAVLALVLAVPLAGAQLYKYVDKNGKTVYSDQPPVTGDSKQIRAPGVGDGPSMKSAAEKDKVAQKGRDADNDKGKKAEDAAKETQRKAAACEQAKVRYQTFSDGGRIYKYNSAGEREYMSDEEIESSRTAAKREMDEACKSS